METHKNSYQLKQGKKEYILTTSLLGNSIKIVCKNRKEQSFNRVFTLDELKNLDKVFNIIKSPKEALDFIDKALRIQKVGVKEQDGRIKIIFYFTTKGLVHEIKIPLGKIGMSSSSSKDFISNNEQNLQKPNIIEEYSTTNYTTKEHNFQNLGDFQQNSQNLGNVVIGSSNIIEQNTNFDVNQFLGQTNTNTNEFITEGESTAFNSIENITLKTTSSNNNKYISELSQNQNYDNLALNTDNSNVNEIAGLTTTNEQYTTDNIIQTANTFQDLGHIQSQYNTNSVPIPSFDTNQYLTNLETTNQYTPPYDTTSIEPPVLPTPTLPIINDTEIVSNDNIIGQTIENTQFKITQDFNINQFTTEGTTINEQFTTGQEFTNQNTEGTITNEKITTGQDFNLNQFGTEGTITNEKFTTGQDFNLNQFGTEGTISNEQFTTGQNFNLNQFGTEGTITNEQFTTGQDFNLNQFGTEGTISNELFTTGQNFNLNQFGTEGTVSNEHFTTGQDFNLNQFGTEGTATNEQFTTTQDISSNQFTTQDFDLNKLSSEGTTNNQFTTQDFNLNQFGVEGTTTTTSNEQFETQEYTTNQYITSSPNPQFSTKDFSTNQYTVEPTTTNTFDMNQLFQNKMEAVPQIPSIPTNLMDNFNQTYNIEKTNNQNCVETKSTVEPTFTQPTLDQPTFTNQLKEELNIGHEDNIFSSQVTFSLPKIPKQIEFNLQPQSTLDMNVYQEQTQQTQFDQTIIPEQTHYNVQEYTESQYKVEDYPSTQYITNTTQTNDYKPTQTEPIISSPIQKYDDDRINKLEGDTNSLRNEHQKIQYKLNALSGEINTYKTQLGDFEREKAENEVNALRAENRAIKQQLSELNSLRNTAAEVNILRNQLAELEPFRKKAAEMEILKNQIRELNDLKVKMAELNNVKSQLSELDQLRAQVNQMNNLQEKLGELNTLRMQVEDAENLRRKIRQMETDRAQYEQEIENLRNSQKIELLKMKRFSGSGFGSNSKQTLLDEKTRNITVKGDIIQNMNELEMITRKINKLNKKITLNLLYKATVDSDKASAFHERCDSANSSLVLIETDKGKRFGGFTTCSWRGDCIDKKDKEAFVFSLDKMMIYENIPGENAVGCYPKFGPIFLGCQIRIYDNAFTKGGTTFEKGLNYNTEEDYELTGGDRVFGVKEIEVYEVIV